MNPLIIIGMHRSGTTLLSQLLQTVGVHMGTKRDENEESAFFRKYNDWLLRISGATWDNPEPIKWLFDDEQTISDVIVPYLTWSYRYFGSVEYWSMRSLMKKRADVKFWGWKDPRNTYTFPVWTQMFPEAKLINITRHGMDVAISLMKRNLALKSESIRRLRYLRGLYGMQKKISNLTYSQRCVSLDGAMSLWFEYCRQAQINLKNSHCPSITIKYEDILEDAESTLNSICDFVGVKPGKRCISRAAQIVKTDGAFRYENHPDYKVSAVKWANLLEKLGYHP